MVLSGGSTSPRVQRVQGVQDGDRFYCPPGRRHLRAAAKEAAEEKEKDIDIAEEEKSKCNLERILGSTSLVVPAHFFPTSSISARGRRHCQLQNHTRPLYYNLTDLWESLKEWSAYGASVPLVLNGTDSVVQYYVPFLSAIQLFVHSPHSGLTSRRQAREDSDGSEEEASSDSESERPVPVGRERREDKPTCTPYGEAEVDGGFSSDDSDSNSSQHQLPVFQFFEHEPPYARQPLADKIWTLTAKYPELKMYRSCDLLPSSWISVAWYFLLLFT